MSQLRASCWSITLFYDVANKPVDETFEIPSLPVGWKVEGQLEKCPDTGKLHFQGMAKTPQVRLSALSRIFGSKNHFEKARNVNELTQYVHKEETREKEVASKASMNMYEFATYISERFVMEDYQEMIKAEEQKCYDSDGKYKYDKGDVMLEYIDELVCDSIEEGVMGAEWNGSNPAFRAMWKKFGLAVVKRTLRARQDRQTDTPVEA